MNLDIPTDMLKQTIDVHLPIMTQIINMPIDNYRYPNDLKLAEVNPVFKKEDDLDKENYRPVSQYFISCLKSLRKNHVPTNRRCHERQIVRKKSQHSALIKAHA